jgi:type IV secretion system protein TrbJ
MSRVPIRKYVIASALGLSVSAAIIMGVSLPSAPASARISVFDPSNYTQNLLTAARTLQQINNQIQSLQNEAQMLVNQGKNLARIDFPQLDQLRRKLAEIDRLMGQAQGIDFRIDQLDERYRQLFPDSFDGGFPARPARRARPRPARQRHVGVPPYDGRPEPHRRQCAQRYRGA